MKGEEERKNLMNWNILVIKGKEIIWVVVSENIEEVKFPKI